MPLRADVPMPVVVEEVGREGVSAEVATDSETLTSAVLRGEAVAVVTLVPGAEEDVPKRPMLCDSIISVFGKEKATAEDVTPVTGVTALVLGATGLVVPMLLESREEIVSKAEVCA